MPAPPTRDDSHTRASCAVLHQWSVVPCAELPTRRGRACQIASAPNDQCASAQMTGDLLKGIITHFLRDTNQERLWTPGSRAIYAPQCNAVKSRRPASSEL